MKIVLSHVLESSACVTKPLKAACFEGAAAEASGQVLPRSAQPPAIAHRDDGQFWEKVEVIASSVVIDRFDQDWGARFGFIGLEPNCSAGNANALIVESTNWSKGLMSWPSPHEGGM